MKITISPIASNKRSIIEVQGDKLIYDSIEYDLSVIPDGGEVEASSPAIGKIKRVDGEIEITLEYTYDVRDCKHEERFPNNPYIITEGVLNV